MANTIKLGQEVKDKVTGFQGIAYSRTTFIRGCARIEILPKVKEDGKIPDVYAVDEPDLEIISNGVYVPIVKVLKKPLGGPHSGHNPGNGRSR